jgi:hypothetical protein
MSRGIVFARAYLCPDCPEFYAMGSAEVINYAIDAGITYWEPPVTRAVWPNARVLIESNGNCFLHMGHSNASELGGDYTGLGVITAISIPESIAALAAKAVYSFSCKAGQVILPAILADTTAPAVGGYIDDYWYYIDTSYQDIYFQSTMKPGFEFMRSVIDDRTWQQCFDDTIAKFNTEYEKWVSGIYKDEPYAANIAAVLLMDRDALWVDGDMTWNLSGGTPTNQLYTGSLTIQLTPSSPHAAGAVYVGNLAFALTLAGSYTTDAPLTYSYICDILFSVIPAAFSIGGITQMDFKAGLYDASGSGITGSTNLVIKVKRDADDLFYDFIDGTFKAAGHLAISRLLSEPDSVNMPGEYEVNIDVSGWDNGVYTAYIQYLGTPEWTDSIEFRVYYGDEANLDRVLGLTHEHRYLDNAIYDANQDLVSCRIRVYSDAASVGTDNNVVDTYTVACTYASGLLTSFAVTRT